MDIEKISYIVKSNYNIDISSIEKIKNIYKITSGKETYCIKVIKYELPHFKFILSSILHVQERGFLSTPKIIKTNTGLNYIEFFDKHAYLTEWIIGRESNYDNPVELGEVACKLGEFHRCSDGFVLQKDVKPRIGWFMWMKVFNTRKNEILDFKKRIIEKKEKTEFDKIYLECINDEIIRAKQSINEIRKSKYLECMEKSVLKRGFCHHDFANHNVLRDTHGGLNVIDFDYCILDTNIHDLSSLMIRGMKNGKWSIERAQNIITNYNINNKISAQEFKIMKGFIRFPQEFWQLGIQRYWEKQPWSDEIFLKRLQRYVEDREMRGEFLNSFFS